MSNTINLASKYLPILDEKYVVESKTSILDVNSTLIRETADAKTILLPKTTLQGLADYNRNSGFVAGDTTLEWESHTFSQDRGRTFTIDSMDNQESAGVAFGTLAGEFIRSYVAPEVDAYRFAKYYSKAGNSLQTSSPAASSIIDLIDTGIGTLDDAEVPENNRVMFVSVAVYNLMKQSSDIAKRFDVTTNTGNVNRKIETFDDMPIVKVPKGRFYSAYTFYDGTTSGQTAGGFVKATDAVEINFMIVDKEAVLQLVKTAKPRIFDPNTNQTADGWKFDYRLYHDAFVPDNKVNGIYVNHK